MDANGSYPLIPLPPQPGRLIPVVSTLVVDADWGTVGSTNLDNRSFALNDELNVVVYDAPTAQQLEAIIKEDLSYSRQVDYRHWRARGLIDSCLPLWSSRRPDSLSCRR